MHRITSTILALTSLVLFLVQNTESQTPVPHCGMPGTYACPAKTAGPPITRDCDYYTCVHYPRLNKWLRRLYNCAPPTGFIKDATTPFNTTLQKCQFDPICPVILGCPIGSAMCTGTPMKCGLAADDAARVTCQWPDPAAATSTCKAAPTKPVTPICGCEN